MITALDPTDLSSIADSNSAAKPNQENLGVSEVDFLKIFMEELSYQDPLKPVDNKTFMAQMAQFSALQEARETNQKISNLLTLKAESLAMSLIGKYVVINKANNKSGKVNYIKFEKGIPKLYLFIDGKTQSYDLSDVAEVRSDKPN